MLCLIQSSTVIQWHRAGIRLVWRWKSHPCKTGEVLDWAHTLKPAVSAADPGRSIVADVN
jgi:hypothetical protein